MKKLDIEDNAYEISPAYEIIDGEIILRPVEELIRLGIRTLESTEKIEDGRIVEKTNKELYEESLITADEYNSRIDILRFDAYNKEADPLFPQVYRGEIEKKIWLDVTEKIKERYPKLNS